MIVIVFSQDRFHPEEEPAIALSNGGYLHGDGVFTTLRLDNGRSAHLADHWQRLVSQARELDLEPTIDLDEVRQILARLVQENGLEDKGARLRLTLARQGQSSVFTMAPANLPPLLDNMQNEGIGVITLGPEYSRKFRPHLKTLNYLPSMQALRQAGCQSCPEAIICDEKGLVLEGAVSNVFALLAGVLITTPADGRILAGLTRRRVLGLAAGVDQDTAERPLRRQDLLQAEEIFLTNSVREVVPVVRVDGEKISEGIPGPVTRQLQELCREPGT